MNNVRYLFFWRDKKRAPQVSGGQVLERRLAFLEETVKPVKSPGSAGFSFQGYVAVQYKDNLLLCQ